MILIKSLVDYRVREENVLKLCTTNATLNSQGHLVMGAGNALSMANEYPAIPKIFAELIQGRLEYGLICTEVGGQLLGGFQTKIDWRLPSTLEIIQHSTDCLMEIVDYVEIIQLPFPGINHGGADKYQVLDIIHHLPDNVHVYF